MDEIRKAFDTGAQEPNLCANSPPVSMGGRYINSPLGLIHCKVYILDIFWYMLKPAGSVLKNIDFLFAKNKQINAQLPHYRLCPYQMCKIPTECAHTSANALNRTPSRLFCYFVSCCWADTHL